MRKKHEKKYIFIDTNMYRGLFLSDKIADIVLPNLKKLSKNKYDVLLPQQILDEVNRNRFSKWIVINNFDSKGQSLDKTIKIIEDNHQELTGAKSFKKSLEREKKRIDKEKTRLEKRLTSSSGKTSKIIKEIVNLAIIIPDSEQITSATLQRILKGNPPLERKEDIIEKNCDRYIWESLLSYFKINQIKRPHLLIFTKNTNEWCIKVGEKKTIHSFLSEEFKKFFGGKLFWFSDLENLPNISQAKKNAVKAEEKKISDRDALRRTENIIAEELRHSNTWDNSDDAMRKAMPYIKHFKSQTIQAILKATQDNDFISSGPYNQVLGSFLAKRFFSELLIRSIKIEISLDVWKNFYVDMNEDQQERFIGIRKTLENRGIEFSLDELKYFSPEDIPF